MYTLLAKKKAKEYLGGPRRAKDSIPQAPLVESRLSVQPGQGMAGKRTRQWGHARGDYKTVEVQGTNVSTVNKVCMRHGMEEANCAKSKVGMRRGNTENTRTYKPTTMMWRITPICSVKRSEERLGGCERIKKEGEEEGWVVYWVWRGGVAVAIVE